MKSNRTGNGTRQASDPVALDESRELLLEVRQATQGTSQSDLHEFACLLLQVVGMHERTNSDADDDHVRAQFIAAGLDEIRFVVGDDQSTSSRMESLRAEAIDRWGDQIAALDQLSSDDASSHDMESWESCPEEGSPTDADVIAPSAEEISSLLSRLGETSAQRLAPESVPALGLESKAFPAANHRADAPSGSLSASVSIDSLDPELREAFLDDASCCVSSMEASLLRLESDPCDADSLNQICRELHTLKGASASVGLSRLADQLHKLEDTLRDDHAAGRSPNIDALLNSVDSIRSQVSEDQQESQPSVAQAKTNSQDQPRFETVQSSALQLSSFSDVPADDETVRVKSSQLNRLMDMLAELVMLRNRRDTEVTELQEVYHELIGSVAKMRLLSNEQNSEVVASSSLQLSEIANDVLEVAQHVRHCARPVAEGNTAVSQFIRQFRQELVELRRTPVGGLFRRLQRVVRDAAQAESKQVDLKLLGEDAGIERSLQQRLYEPLLHIVRNSVCHGIENAEERSRSGKHPIGTISLEAKSGPDLFVIEIRDDGRGLDYDAIRRRGVESGLLAADQAASREELSQLIFRPGFSTRQEANQVAGRGVGMDVVASTLQRMRGWLEVDSEPQQGTRIRLSFPLPSVIQHAMLFRSGGQLFALPMQSVQSAGETDRDSVCLVFSELLGRPAVTLDHSYQGIVLACQVPSSGLGHGHGHGPERVTLLVDEIVGPEEVVVRPLPTLLKQHPFCCGATVSGMGKTVLFLDARRVVQSQSCLLRRQEPGSDHHTLSHRETDTKFSTPARPRVLVADDSLSARKRVVRSLKRYSIDVVEASDGKQALAILKSERFAAVFSDMEMPHVTGMELLAEIHCDNHGDGTPVVIISSRGEDEFTSRAKELGASDYLIKPLADEALDGAFAGIPLLRHLKPNTPTAL